MEYLLYFTEKEINLAIGFLSKIWHFTSQHILKTIYYSLFNSHLNYECHVWGQKIETLQEKAIRIIKLLPNNAPASKEIYKLRILKLKDYHTSKQTFSTQLP